MASIRGHQNKLRLFKSGQPVNLLNITSFEANQDSDFSRSNYVGNQIPEGDQAILGWSGSVDLEVKDATVEDIVDSIIAGNLVGIGVDEISMLLTEEYPNGQTASYVYYDMQLKMSKRSGGLNEKVTKRLDWQASGRIKL
jgi:hypothetical protein